MNCIVIGALLALPLQPLAAAPQAATDTLSLKDLAYGIELTPQDSGPVQTLLLSEDVYRGIRHGDLRDLRVFNAAGEQVPHAVRSLNGRDTLEHEPVRLPLFALRADPAQEGGDLSLQVRRSPDGRVLEVKTRESATTGDANERPIVAYIIDASQVQRPAVGLTLEFPDTGESFLASYTIESSHDLTRWSSVVREATLARLDHDGAQIRKDRVSFPPSAGLYLRLRWLGDAPPVALEQALLELAPEQGALERRSLRLSATQRSAEPHVYDFASAGPLPVHRVQVHLPQPNTLIEATLASASESQGPWSSVLHGRFYSVSQPTALTNAPHDIAPRSDPWWSLRVLPQGGGLGSGLPELELFYFPQQLAFVARGEAPFTLAFGSRVAPHSRFDWQAVTQLLSREEQADLPRQSVSSGPVHPLGGPAVLQQPPKDMTRTYILWAVLVAGVALLGVLSLRLAKQLR